MTKKDLKEHCQKLIKYKQGKLEKFQQNFEANVLYSFEWSESTLAAVALGELAERILKAVNAGHEIEALIKQLRENVLNKARNPTRSSSPMHNLIEQIKNSTEAQFLDEIKYL